MDRVGRAVSFAVIQAVFLEIQGDDLGRAALLQREVEPEAGRALADDGRGLAAQVGQALAGVEHSAELLGLHRMFQRRRRIEGQQAVDGRAVIFAHGAVIGRQAEHAIADFVAVVGRVDGVNDADHFMARFAHGRGIVTVGQIMQMADVAAAEAQAQRLDDGGTRL